MKLPDDCTSAADGRGAGEDIDRDDCCRALGPYWLDEAEQPLCRTRHLEDETYRFFWRSSFDGDGIVYVGRSNNTVTLRWRYRAFRRPEATDSPPVLRLSLPDWGRLQGAISAVNFWSQDVRSDFPCGFDGAQWLIEGRRGDDYHAVHRWSPCGAIYDLGRLFFALVGPPLAGIEMY